MHFIIAAGSSLGSGYLREALDHIATNPNFTIHGVSRTYCNKSEYAPKNYLFFNCAIALSSFLEPQALYWELRSIEQKLGRIRSYANSPRTLDLDVMLSFPFSYSSRDFTVPHCGTFKRSFFVTCAIEALQLAGWPTPFSLYQARSRLKPSVLVPCYN